MAEYKMIQGKSDCKICDGTGVVFNPCCLCDCATLFDLGIPDGSLSDLESIGKLINYRVDIPEPKEVVK